MEYTKITQQAIDFQKMSISSWQNAMTMVQEQATSAMNMMLGQNTWMPEDGRKAIQSWLGACQEEQERFKDYVDESFSSMAKILTPKKKAAPAKDK